MADILPFRMGDVLELPARRPPTAAQLIERSGLSDEEIGERLGDDLVIPVPAGVVKLWREGCGFEPAPALLELLAGL